MSVSDESERIQRSALVKSRENEERFAAANAQIAAKAETLEMNGNLVPFLCECSDRECTEIVQLSLSEFRAARSHSDTAFILLHGHDDTNVERVIAHTDRYLLVEKGQP